MKVFCLGLGLVLVPALLPAQAGAQVVVHQAALDQLAGIAPVAPAVTAPAAVVHHVARRVVRRRVGTPTAVAFQAPPPLPDLAPHPPAAMVPAVVATAVGRPAAVRPPAPSAAPLAAAPPPAKAAAAPAVARPAAVSAVALQFASGSAALPADAAAVLKPICNAAEPSRTVSIAAPAPGVAGDPSVAMRLSMQRAFAIRDALTACGISPARIIPRAVGATGGELDTARISLGARP